MILLLIVGTLAFASYDNYPVMANKYLMPDGSIQTFSGVEVAPADPTRANKYKTMDITAAKWLMPDGSIVSAIPISTDSLDAMSVTGLTLGTNATITVSNSVNATITGDFGSAAYLDVGTNANEVVQFDGSGKYPAADGSQITSIDVAHITRAVSWGGVSGDITTGHILVWNGNAGNVQDGGALAPDNFTASFPGVVCKDSGGNITKCTNLSDSSYQTHSGNLDVIAGNNGENLTNIKKQVAAFSFDGGSSAIANSTQRCTIIDEAITLTGYTLSVNDVANVTFQITAAVASANIPTTDITNGNNISTNAERFKIDKTLSGWTTSLAANTEICANVTVNDSAKWISLKIFAHN